MRTVFYQFFRPPPEAFQRLWKEALIAYDASVLLNFYGYSEEARRDLMDVIRRYAERTRLPHQFALEYVRNRVPTILKQVANYRATQQDFSQIESQRLQPKREHPFLSEAALQAFQSIQQELMDRRALVERMVDSDDYMDVLISAFEGRLSAAPDAKLLEALHADAAARFDAKTPPGYRDADKKASDTRPTADPYGDYIAWKQLMEVAASEKKDFILVIDDVKDDWWRIESDKSGKHKYTVGPRPELMEEFHKETGQHVWFYTSEDFLRAAKQYDAAGVKDEVIEEVGAHLNAKRAAITEQIGGSSGDESEAEDRELPKRTSDEAKFIPAGEKVSRPDDAAKARRGDGGDD